MGWLYGVLIALAMYLLAMLFSWYAVYGRKGAGFNWRILTGPNRYSDWLTANGWCFIGKMYETPISQCGFHRALSATTDAVSQADVTQEALAKFNEALRSAESP